MPLTRVIDPATARTEYIPTVPPVPYKRRPAAWQAAGWVAVGVLLLIATGIFIIDWRLLHL